MNGILGNNSPYFEGNIPFLSLLMGIKSVKNYDKNEIITFLGINNTRE